MIAKLYAIADLGDLAEDESFVTALLRAGAGLVQLRAKKIDAPALREFTRRVLALRNELAPGCRVIVNDFVEIAAETGADGVHLGQGDGSPIEARKILGPDAFIGLSTHNVEQVRRAPVDHLDYLAFGPVFESRTKSGHAPVTGLAALTAIVKESSLPVVAIGGINAENAGSVFAAGAASVAVISYLRAGDLAENISKLSAA